MERDTAEQLIRDIASNSEAAWSCTYIAGLPDACGKCVRCRAKALVQKPDRTGKWTEEIDPATLTPEQIRAAITYNGYRWGSFAYFIADEITRAERDPAGVFVSREVYADGTTGPMRAHYRSPEHRASDLERAAARERTR